MKLSYEAIGQWCATFACANVSEGKLVKISADDTVALCTSGDAFAGVVTGVAHDGGACSVALGGFVTVPYTGTTAPAAGFSKLSADGDGGVKVDAASGTSYLVAEVDTTGKTVTFKL